MPEKAVDMSPNAYAIQNASVIQNLFRNLQINTMKQFARAIDRNLIVRCERSEAIQTLHHPRDCSFAKAPGNDGKIRRTLMCR
ncbi:MAG: hypothetical protein AMJ37_00435 [Dehalococcoidia bacterium DG_18]|nr:MAG: hypothetical protein AMJ37_00435 [Dehalococcoidia bacterium DG_18]